jgi:hypothetical protein
MLPFSMKFFHFTSQAVGDQNEENISHRKNRGQFLLMLVHSPSHILSLNTHKVRLDVEPWLYRKPRMATKEAVVSGF